MKFTLTYEGEMPSTGNSSKKGAKKWEIRKHFHPQLSELTRIHPVLKDGFERGNIIPKGNEGFQVIAHHHSVKEVEEYEWPEGQSWDLCERIEVKGRKFWPIVRESLALTCNLNILFLRKEEPGSLVLQGGDIDNRIKTLFDSLRMPSADEVIDDPTIEDPIFCLLESDTLITGFNIKTDRLLSKPNTSVHQVHLVIDVDVRVSHAGLYNIGYMGD